MDLKNTRPRVDDLPIRTVRVEEAAMEKEAAVAMEEEEADTVRVTEEAGDGDC